MDLESISSPLPNQTPQMRYASLHRAVERGLASESTLCELTRVCVELDLHDEAQRWFDKIETSTERFHLQNLLVRNGIITRPDNKLREVSDGDSQYTLADDIQEGVSFLAQGQMPVTVTVATAMFPLAVGIGGYLTSGNSSILLVIAAMVPALMLLMAVGALARRILVDSAMGIEDPPCVPKAKQLAQEAVKAAGEALGIGGCLLGPALVLYLVGLPLRDVLIASGLGALLLPMALMLKAVRNDWKSLTPRLMGPALYRGGLSYVTRAAATLGLFAPAAVCWYASGNAVVYLKIALVGPLVVAPMLIAARMMGRFLATRRPLFAELMNVAPNTPRVAKATPKTRKASTGSPQQVTASTRAKVRTTKRTDRPAPKRPAGKKAVGRLRTTTRSKPQRAPAGAVPAPPPSQSTRRSTPPPTTRQPQPEVAQEPTQPPQATRGPQQQPTLLGNQQNTLHDDVPDLLNMPGFRAVTGSDRVHAGAAARPRR